MTTWRVPPYDVAADKVEAFVRARFGAGGELHGIVVSGSVVRGEGGPTSDLDIEVIHRGLWRQRLQRRFNRVPCEIFVNPPASIRRYFESEHKDGRPCTAHMLATGEVLAGADDVVMELVAEAKAWLAKPLVVDAAALTSERYHVVDLLDDARDTVAADPAAASLLAAEAVRLCALYVFARGRGRQPRRKDLVRALGEHDAIAAELVARWSSAPSAQAQLDVALELARHVIGADTFFEWESAPDKVEPQSSS